MMARWPGSLVLAGAGKMGGAMLRGWLAGGLAPEAVRIVDPHLDSHATEEWRARGISVAPPDVAPDVLVLALKPQSFVAEAGSFALLATSRTLVISILAGKTLASLRTGLPNASAIVRAMPNLPASIGLGATGVAAESSLSPSQRTTAHALLESVGLVEWLDEAMIDAVTALSGSGPAYVFYFAECLAQAGIAAGLAPDVAAQLARATVEGAAALMRAETGQSPAALRDAVTSPGGTTAAALDVFRGPEGLAPLTAKAVAAAKRRAAELAD